MKPLYPTLLVANGRDPLDVLSEVMIPTAHGSSEYLYHPGRSTPGRVVVGGPENLTPVNHDWLEKWHRENPEYELRSPYHKTAAQRRDMNAYSERRAIAMPSADDITANHHEISADVVHVPTKTRVGDFHFTLADWPQIPQGKHIATAHVWTFYRHNQTEPDQHHGVMTHVLDSWVNHAKAHGVQHGYVQGDASHGYWLKNITRHPDMVWGGVEWDEQNQRTRPAGSMGPRQQATLRSAPGLFVGWPGTRAVRPKAVGESDAFTLRWNQENPKPSHRGGPLPTHLMRFEKGRMKSYPGHLDKACYFHALRIARKNPNMKLAVGFIVAKDEAHVYEKGGEPPLMFTHAFNITKNGEVHDPTLGSERASQHRYYGHVVENPQQFKTSADLANWVGHHYQTGHDRGPGGVHMGIQADIDHRAKVTK